jgi:hypothetical protein
MSIDVWSLSLKGERGMALNHEDKRPVGLSERERYERIRLWYQANVERFALRDNGYGVHAKLSKEYIQNLPPPESASPEQIANLFYHVRYGNLEWAYHQKDGNDIKMAAYAEG